MITVTNSGPILVDTNAVFTLNSASLSTSNNFGTYAFVVGRGGRENGATAVFNGSTVRVDRPIVIQGGQASALPASSLAIGGGTLIAGVSIIVSNATDDAFTRLIVDGGAYVEAGNLIIQRCLPANGLILSNGIVVCTNIILGAGASRAGCNIFGGSLTNTGDFKLNNVAGNGSSDRKTYYSQRGGTVVCTGAGGIILGNVSNTGTTGATIANQGAIVDISGGTLIVEGITLLANTGIANTTAKMLVSGSSAVYIGGGGLVINLGGSGSTATFALTNATLGAKADWSSTANFLIQSGTTTFRAADIAGAAHNITLTNVISGNGALTKTGGGILSLNGNCTYFGGTTINTGTLALGPKARSPTPRRPSSPPATPSSTCRKC